jgi:triosephosphate isomerase
VIQEQLEGSLDPALNASPFVIAYEPVWAIGTGLVPSASQIEEVHGFCRRHLVSAFGSTAVDVPLLYGGSVKGSNAAEIFAVKNVDGALVGGASLRADDFSAIIDALENA